MWLIKSIKAIGDIPDELQINEVEDANKYTHHFWVKFKGRSYKFGVTSRDIKSAKLQGPIVLYSDDLTNDIVRHSSAMTLTHLVDDRYMLTFNTYTELYGALSEERFNCIKFHAIELECVTFWSDPDDDEEHEMKQLMLLGKHRGNMLKPYNNCAHARLDSCPDKKLSKYVENAQLNLYAIDKDTKRIIYVGDRLEQVYESDGAEAVKDIIEKNRNVWCEVNSYFTRQFREGYCYATIITDASSGRRKILSKLFDVLPTEELLTVEYPLDAVDDHMTRKNDAVSIVRLHPVVIEGNYKHSLDGIAFVYANDSVASVHIPFMPSSIMAGPATQCA